MLLLTDRIYKYRSLNGTKKKIGLTSRGMIGPQGKPPRTEGLIIPISKERLGQIEAIRDEEIDYSDISETDAAFWEKAELRMPQPKNGV